MNDVLNITIGDQRRDVVISESSEKKVEIDDKVFVVPADVANFIDEMASEIKRQQTQKVATDEILDKRIDKRVARIVNALAGAGMLTHQLDEETPLPTGIESDTRHTFYSDVCDVIKRGLKTGTDLRDDLFNATRFDY